MEKHTNRLVHETSPYLLQHAHNPVDWYPWGDEALERAKRENKLLLISIGYSACHWCHVMEHESFEDNTVATMMNEHFVCVKVDREERPDVDQVYMDALQLLTGRGGWPLNCFALPDGRIVYGGTYFRKPDWLNLLSQLHKLYAFEKERLIEQAEAIQEGVIKQEMAQIKEEKSSLSIDDVNASISKMSKGFDAVDGGFNGAPKFPMPSIWNFILNVNLVHPLSDTNLYTIFTLEKMALGGIYDHIGGGFSRYSVDTQWHVPHFEKMLYDNAQLVSAYSKAYRLTQNEHFKRVVDETLNFIKRELTSSEGAFYAALDADSEGEEGKFYVWTAKELKSILGKDYPLIAEYYSVTDEGNWENGVNVLKSVEVAAHFATRKSIRLNDFLSALEIVESKLLNARSHRVRPGLDDKIIASWNALMIKGYVDAYEAFHHPAFLDSAIGCAQFMKTKFMKSDFSMHRTYKKGASKISAFLDDYCFTANAFISLYQATFDESWLLDAKQLTEYVLARFHDQQSGFFFYTSVLDAPLAVRKKEMVDNVIPSSNSVMAENLLLLSTYFNWPAYYDIAFNMLSAMAYEVNNYGRFYSNWGSALLHVVVDTKEIVITGAAANDYYREISGKAKGKHLFAVAAQKSELPIFNDRFVEGRTSVFVCENNTCQLPVHSVEEAIKLIG